MKSLVGNGKDFEFNSKINRKPMEIFGECLEFKKIRMGSFPPNLTSPSNLDKDSLFHNKIWVTMSRHHNATLHRSAHFSPALQLFFGHNKKISSK